MAITPSEKRRGDSKSLPPHGGQTVSSGQILLKTQGQYSINWQGSQQKRKAPALDKGEEFSYNVHVLK